MKRNQSEFSSDVEKKVRPALRATTPLVWVCGYTIMLISSALRFPSITSEVKSSVPPDLADAVGDPGMTSFALNVGIGLAAVMVAAFYAVLLAACAGVDKRLVSRGCKLSRDHTAGYCFTSTVFVVGACQSWAAMTGRGAQPPSAGTYVMALVILAVVAWVFRPQLRELTRARQFSAVAVSAFLALLPVLR